MVPALVVVVIFSASNRESVPLNLWPILDAVAAPLFAVVLAAFAAGFTAGAASAWISAGPARRRARAFARRAEAAERQLERPGEAAAARQATESRDVVPADAA